MPTRDYKKSRQIISDALDAKGFRQQMRDLGFSRKTKGDVAAFTKDDLVVTEEFGGVDLEGARFHCTNFVSAIAVLACSDRLDMNREATTVLWDRLIGDY
jgi:hypothetical protein